MKSEVLMEDRGTGIDTRRKCGYDDTAYALVETSEEDLLVNCIGRFVQIQAIVVGRLESGLECVEWVDKQIDCESSECASLDNWY